MKILDTPPNGQSGLIAKSISAQHGHPTCLPILQSSPRRRRGNTCKSRMPVLGAKDLQLHRQLMNDGRLKSGRAGAYVYYVRDGQQRSRRYVVPRDPRTPAQQRARAIFSAASRTWSATGPLSDQQRDAWRTEGAQTRSRPRLGSSGKLTGQKHFVGRNCAKAQREHSLLWEPPQPEHNETTPAHPPVLVMERKQSQRVTESTWDRPRTYTGALPWPCAWNTRQATSIGRIGSLDPLPGNCPLCPDPRPRLRWRGGQQFGSRLTSAFNGQGLLAMVGNYLRNSAQDYTVLDFLSARSQRQTDAAEHIRSALAAYDVQAIDTLIGDRNVRIVPDVAVSGASANPGVVNGLLGVMLRNQANGHAPAKS